MSHKQYYKRTWLFTSGRSRQGLKKAVGQRWIQLAIGDGESRCKSHCTSQEAAAKAEHTHTPYMHTSVTVFQGMAGLRMNDRGSVAALAPWGLL
jgi:hypothetical protein